MQDHPQVSAVAKDVSNCQTKLKELLASGREPWDKDTELVRQRLRKAYLQLLFNFPYAPQSKKADTRMWLDTSHALISVYKDRLAALDKLLAAPTDPRAQQQQSRSRHGPVEYRKLAQRFRQFLAEEEKFWIAFVTRFVRLFALDEAKLSLVALGIDTDESEQQQQQQEPGANSQSQSRSRWLLFPAETSPVAVSANQRGERLLILSKALVCIGDVARYREQWNESGGRPKGGKETHDEQPRRAGRAPRREPLPRPRNYTRARECYERARAIFPESGNASHQLAILASYEADTFISLYHYYRSLSVKAPYTAALENMEKQMTRYLEQHPPNHLSMNTDGGEPPAPRVQVDNFKESVIVLHALWRSSDADADTDLQRLSDDVVKQLEAQVTARVLPPDLIVKTVVLAIGALWTHRMYRKPKPTDLHRGIPVEALIQIHILDIFRALGRVGISQLTDVTSTPADSALDIAQHITAVLRRMLPALRVCSKWVRTNLDSLRHASLQTNAVAELGDAASKLWDTYIDFASLLLRVFPLDALKPMRGALEEDVDLGGFAPLKSTMLRPSKETASGLAPSHTEVHPNEEQLMRIHDLLQDAMALSQTSYSPIVFGDNTFSLRREESVLEIPPSMLLNPISLAPPVTTLPSRRPATVSEDQDDDARTVSTRTDDDPVNLAMRATLSQYGGEEEDDDDEEQILYPKNLMTPVRASRLPAITPGTPVMNPLTPHAPAKPLGFANGFPSLVPQSVSPPANGPATPVTASRPQLHGRTTSSTTAGDLVAQFLGGRHLGEASIGPRRTSGTPASLLFGASGSTGQSIWSTGLDATSSPSPLVGGMFPSPPQSAGLTPGGGGGFGALGLGQGQGQGQGQNTGFSPPSAQAQHNAFSHAPLSLGGGGYSLSQPSQPGPSQQQQIMNSQSSRLSNTHTPWQDTPYQSVPNYNPLSSVPPTQTQLSGGRSTGFGQSLPRDNTSFMPSLSANQYASSSYGSAANAYSAAPMRGRADLFADSEGFGGLGGMHDQLLAPSMQQQQSPWPPQPPNGQMFHRGWS